MKKLLTVLFTLLYLDGFGQSLQWRNPTTTQFGSNNYVLTLKSGVVLTNPVVNSGTITGDGGGLTNILRSNVLTAISATVSIAGTPSITPNVTPSPQLSIVVTNNVNPFIGSTQIFNAYPGLAIARGTNVYVSWVSGPGDAEMLSSLYISGSTNYGTNWSTAQQIAPTTKVGNIGYEGTELTLLDNGQLLLTSSEMGTNSGSGITSNLLTIQLTANADGTVTPLATNRFFQVPNAVWNKRIWSESKPFKLANGNWVWPVNGLNNGATCWMQGITTTSDQFTNLTTPTLVASNTSVAYAEGCLVQFGDTGEVVMFSRAEDLVTYSPTHNAWLARISGNSTATTWGTPTNVWQYPSGSTNVVGKPSVVNLGNNVLLMQTRYQLAPYQACYSLSYDRGYTWTTPVLLGPSANYNYGSILLKTNGMVASAFSPSAGSSYAFTRYIEYTPGFDAAFPGQVTNLWSRWAEKQSDQSVNNFGGGSAVTNDAELLLPIGPFEHWNYHFNILGSTAESPAAIADFQFTFNGPSDATKVSWTWSETQNSANATRKGAFGQISTVSITYPWDGLWGDLVVWNGPTAGTIQFQWGQRVATATNTTVQAGSVLSGVRTR